MDYKEIPEGAINVLIYAWWCGDEYCNCNSVRIAAEIPKEHPLTPHWIKPEDGLWQIDLWESDVFCAMEDNFDINEIRKEVQEACEYYGIEADLSDDCIWDWEGERKL